MGVYELPPRMGQAMTQLGRVPRRFVPFQGIAHLQLFSGHKSDVSSTFNKNVEELASRQASITRYALPSPSNCPNVSSGVIPGHHLVGIKQPPFPLEIARNQFLVNTI
jgi:hypothetical protein